MEKISDPQKKAKLISMLKKRKALKPKTEIDAVDDEPQEDIIEYKEEEEDKETEDKIEEKQEKRETGACHDTGNCWC